VLSDSGLDFTADTQPFREGLAEVGASRLATNPASAQSKSKSYMRQGSGSRPDLRGTNEDLIVILEMKVLSFLKIRQQNVD
jgi:hypothetical protein